MTAKTRQSRMRTVVGLITAIVLVAGGGGWTVARGVAAKDGAGVAVGEGDTRTVSGWAVHLVRPSALKSAPDAGTWVGLTETGSGLLSIPGA